MIDVRVIKGTYGYRNANGVVKPKNAKSGIFSLDDAEAERLVALGVAETVATAPIAPSAEPQGDSLEEDVNEYKPDYSVATPVAELRKIAKTAGISFPVGMTKEEMVRKLDEIFDMPALDAALPDEL